MLVPNVVALLSEVREDITLARSAVVLLTVMLLDVVLCSLGGHIVAKAVCDVVSLFCVVCFREVKDFTVSVLDGTIGASIEKAVEGTVAPLVERLLKLVLTIRDVIVELLDEIAEEGPSVFETVTLFAIIAVVVETSKLGVAAKLDETALNTVLLGGTKAAVGACVTGYNMLVLGAFDV